MTDKPPFDFDFKPPGAVTLAIVVGALVLLAVAGLVLMAVMVLT